MADAEFDKDKWMLEMKSKSPLPAEAEKVIDDVLSSRAGKARG